MADVTGRSILTVVSILLCFASGSSALAFQGERSANSRGIQVSQRGGSSSSAVVSPPKAKGGFFQQFRSATDKWFGGDDSKQIRAEEAARKGTPRRRVPLEPFSGQPAAMQELPSLPKPPSDPPLSDLPAPPQVDLEATAAPAPPLEAASNTSSNDPSASPRSNTAGLLDREPRIESRPVTSLSPKSSSRRASGKPVGVDEVPTPRLSFSEPPTASSEASVQGQRKSLANTPSPVMASNPTENPLESSADGESFLNLDRPLAEAAWPSVPRRPVPSRPATPTERVSAQTNNPIASSTQPAEMVRVNANDRNSTPQDEGSELAPVPMPQLPSTPGAFPGKPETSAGNDSSLMALPSPPAAMAPVPMELKPSDISIPLPSAPSTTSAPSDFAPLASKKTPSSLAMHLPAIDVRVVGPETVPMDRPATFELVVSHRGREPIEGMLIQVSVPEAVAMSIPEVNEQVLIDQSEGLRQLVWQVDQLPGATEKRLAFQLQSSKPELFAAEIEWTALPQTGSLPLQVAAAQLQVALEGPSQVVFGRPEIFRVRVKNPGTLPAETVQLMVQAGSLAESMLPIGTIPAGAEEVVEVELDFKHSGMIPVSVAAEGAAGSLKAKSTIDVAVRQGSLELSWAAPETSFVGATAQWTLHLNNPSDLAIDSIQCSLELPEGVDLIEAPKGAKVEGRTIQWQEDSLQAGSSRQRGLVVACQREGTIAWKSQAVGSAGAAASASGAMKAEAVTDLQLQVRDPAAPASTDKPAVYEVTITNQGHSTARDIVVVAQFSDGIEPMEASGHPNRIVPGQVLFEAVEKLEPGQSIRLAIAAKASRPGTHRFRAEVSSSQGDEQWSQEESTRFIQGSDAKSNPVSPPDPSSSPVGLVAPPVAPPAAPLAPPR
jgi:hypothetical protein